MTMSPQKGRMFLQESYTFEANRPIKRQDVWQSCRTVLVSRAFQGINNQRYSLFEGLSRFDSFEKKAYS